MRSLFVTVLFLGLLFPSIAAAEDSALYKFMADVAKEVVAEVISEQITAYLKSPEHPAEPPPPKAQEQAFRLIDSSPQPSALPPSPAPQVAAATEDDARRIRAIIGAVSDMSIPLSERIGLYATRVDYFSAGIVDHNFIAQDRERFENRWPESRYTLKSLDQLATMDNRRYAIVRYTMSYAVARATGEQRSGTSEVLLVIESFDSQPRIAVMKEWVHRD